MGVENKYFIKTSCRHSGVSDSFIYDGDLSSVESVVELKELFLNCGHRFTSPYLQNPKMGLANIQIEQINKL